MGGDISEEQMAYPDAKDKVITRQLEEIKRLRKVLEFYADPFKAGDIRIPDFYDELEFGERAREVLADQVDTL